MQMNGKLCKGMRTVVAVAAVVAITGCTTQYKQHGYVPEEEDLQQIVPGVDTRASVEELIGVPSTSGVRRSGGYYYVQSQVKHYAWTRPKVVDREVLAITFSNDDVVENIVMYGLEDGHVVSLQRNVTKTGDGDQNFIRQLFGNIGGLDASGLVGG